MRQLVRTVVIAGAGAEQGEALGLIYAGTDRRLGLPGRNCGRLEAAAARRPGAGSLQIELPCPDRNVAAEA